MQRLLRGLRAQCHGLVRGIRARCCHLLHGLSAWCHGLLQRSPSTSSGSQGWGFEPTDPADRPPAGHVLAFGTRACRVDDDRLRSRLLQKILEHDWSQGWQLFPIGPFIRSSFQRTSGGVEMAPHPLGVAMKNAPFSTVLIYTRQEWKAFVAGVKAGAFDLVPA